LVEENSTIQVGVIAAGVVRIPIRGYVYYLKNKIKIIIMQV
jgi:hypothetical protein